ncbi:MAG: PIN domain-containing protein [Bryobacterales bacterium]|nr:PIN domain-containing protein [Bryobacterales bacterium]MBV8905731.1 PIN domain-containing protein [Terriglobia bacterium]MBV9401632.1 PIN domain-containing protein [Bryobacterales bacterium]
MIGVDTNILIYAHRRDSEWHQRAARALEGLAENPAPWAIPWPCVHEFLSIVTHPRIYAPPSPGAKAIEQVETWMESPSLVLIGELKGHWDELKKTITGGKITGGMVHDARVAAICIEHGVRELWSADRDFSRFGRITVRNPLTK